MHVQAWTSCQEKTSEARTQTEWLAANFFHKSTFLTKNSDKLKISNNYLANLNGQTIFLK